MTQTSIRLISADQFKRSSWKNGLGHTDQIAIYPETAELKRGDFLWRISSAQIEQSSAFSSFPHHDRILIVLKGAGMRIFHRFEAGDPEELMELPAFEPYEFPGDISSRCELTDGAVRDLSIFFRKAEVESSVETTELSTDPYLWQPSGRWNFVFAAENTLKIESPHADLTVPEGSAAQVELSGPLLDGENIQLSGTGRVVLVSFQG